MSNIPEPQIVAEGRLPSVGEKLLFAQEVIEGCSTEEVKLVLYGSLAREDATLRSDIDLCAAPPFERYTSFNATQVEDEANKEIARRGWDTNITVLNCASKRGDAQHNRNRFMVPSDPDEAIFSITTFDHFRFLAADPRFTVGMRQLYRAIQGDIRQYTGTGLDARARDLRRYIERCLYTADVFLNSSHQARWPKNKQDLSYYGLAENIVYHCLRKLAGIAKTLKGSDAKATLAACFDPKVPLFAELLGHFGVVRQFGLDIETVLTHCYGLPERRGEYETFLAARLGGLAEAAITILKLLRREIEQKTLLETISTYDREKAKTVLVVEGFDEWFERRRELGVVLAVHWWCAGERVYVGIPYEAYVNYRSEVLPFGDSPRWWGKELKKEYITAEGRIELALGTHPWPNRPYVYARPKRPERSDYQQAARLAHEAVLAKLREILPADIAIIAPSP